jgi:DNA-directed RNA polymerase subunit RPC12/RpoP
MTTEAKETTSDTSEGIECPACGETVLLSKEVSVDFTARAVR